MLTRSITMCVIMVPSLPGTKVLAQTSPSSSSHYRVLKTVKVRGDGGQIDRIKHVLSGTGSLAHVLNGSTLASKGVA